MTLIKRDKYFSQIKEFINKDIIKVFVWQRRSGKSKILLQIIEYIKFNFKKNNIIFIDKENLKRDHIKTYIDLYNETKNYKHIFIDEIQNIENWEKAVLSLQNEWKDIYITWSNSNLLWWNLATNLRWRYIKIDIYPLDYKEFLNFHKLTRNKESFDQYITFWWLPYLINLKLEQEIVNQYLKSIGETIILKDIIERFFIRNAYVFNKLIVYLAKNIWSIFSWTNISNFLKNEKISLSYNTILWYLDYLSQAIVLNEVPRYDIKWKKIFEVRQKYFFTDWWIRNAFVWWYNKIDISWVLENLVYMNLKSNWWNINIWEINKREVDFVCEKEWKTIYIQVAYLLESRLTKEREFKSLINIHDSWQKYVITLDEWAWWYMEWIKWMNITEFVYEVCNWNI